jgi:RHS repeat-associated protein
VGIETLAVKKSTGEKLFYHNDHLGGVNVITAQNGNLAQLAEYDPWGTISRQEGSGETLLRFTGQELDVETELMYYGGRYYDPELSRFVSPDPFVADMFNPQSLNRYAYVLNNPFTLIDPDGFFHRYKDSGSFFTSPLGIVFQDRSLHCHHCDGIAAICRNCLFYAPGYRAQWVWVWPLTI